MDLNLREAADALGVHPRTLRGWLARAKIVGRKEPNGQWVVPRRNLPLTEDQRAALQRRADGVRSAVEAALPSRAARHTGDRRRSFVDLESFRAAHALLAEVRAANGTGPTGSLARSIEEGIEELCIGACAFDVETKLPALRRARAAFARSLARVLAGAPMPPGAPHVDWARRLEEDILPALGGLLRWAERLGRDSREGRR